MEFLSVYIYNDGLMIKQVHQYRVSFAYFSLIDAYVSMVKRDIYLYSMLATL